MASVSLLALPPELRVMIYREFFAIAPIVKHGRDRRNIVVCDCAYESANTDFLSLLLTCRTIYNEAEYEFWKCAAVVDLAACAGPFYLNGTVYQTSSRTFDLWGFRILEPDFCAMVIREAVRWSNTNRTSGWNLGDVHVILSSQHVTLHYHHNACGWALLIRDANVECHESYIAESAPRLYDGSFEAIMADLPNLRHDGPARDEIRMFKAEIERFEAEHALLTDLGRLPDVVLS